MHRSPRAFAPGASSRGLFPAAALLATVVPARADVTLKEATVSSGLAGSGHRTGERAAAIAGDQGGTERSFAENPGMDPQSGSGPAATCTERAKRARRAT